VISKNKLILAAPVLLLLAACAKEQPSPAVVECTYPDSTEQISAPGWVCDEPLTGAELSAVGFAQKSNAGIAFMKQMATADARVQLAQTFKIHVNNMVKQHAKTTGAGDSETLDQVNESVTKAITSETLYGSRLFKSKLSPSGNLFVIVGMDSEKVQKAAEENILSSMKNESALWQTYLADKAHEELAAEIAKTKVED
jgi:hypothetical protein